MKESCLEQFPCFNSNKLVINTCPTAHFIQSRADVQLILLSLGPIGSRSMRDGIWSSGYFRHGQNGQCTSFCDSKAWLPSSPSSQSSQSSQSWWWWWWLSSSSFIITSNMSTSQLFLAIFGYRIVVPLFLHPWWYGCPLCVVSVRPVMESVPVREYPYNQCSCLGAM